MLYERVEGRALTHTEVEGSLVGYRPPGEGEQPDSMNAAVFGCTNAGCHVREYRVVLYRDDTIDSYPRHSFCCPLCQESGAFLRYEVRCNFVPIRVEPAPVYRVVMLLEARREHADEALSLYDFGDEVCVEADGWEHTGDTWQCNIYLDRENGPTEKMLFIVRFQKDSPEVEEAYLRTP